MTYSAIRRSLLISLLSEGTPPQTYHPTRTHMQGRRMCCITPEPAAAAGVPDAGAAGTPGALLVHAAGGPPQQPRSGAAACPPACVRVGLRACAPATAEPAAAAVAVVAAAAAVFQEGGGHLRPGAGGPFCGWLWSACRAQDGGDFKGESKQ
eukprot:1161013-Pelagomonas_calceolata.AAC.15